MNEDELYIALGKQIKFLRENAHLTQEKLAEKAGISLDYLGKIEVHINQNGKVEINGMGDFSSINKNFCLQLGKDNVK
jgi:DNA-binding XRE family transcriptional regulator